MLPCRAVLAAIALAAASPLPLAAPAVADEPPAWWQDEAEANDEATTADPSAPQPQGPLPGQAPAQAPPSSLPVVRTKTVPGRVARVTPRGLASIPRGAPKRVRTLIAAYNRIIGKPYVWGGGHARVIDRGYDCSGAVSYGLIRVGLLGGPQVSGSLARLGSGGKGRWVTVYANRGHVYLEVAGLRLDTSSVGDPTGRSGTRWRPAIGKRSGFAVRHPVGW